MGAGEKVIHVLFAKPTNPVLKKILRIANWTIGILLILELVGYIVIPSAIKLYISWSDPDLFRRISTTPRVYTSLPSPPSDWQKIKLGNAFLSLPLTELTRIYQSPTSSNLRMKFNYFSLVCSDMPLIASSMKTHQVSFWHFETLAKAHPDQISILMWPWENWRTMKILILKSGISGAEMDIFERGNIKGVITHRYRSTSDIYSFYVFSKTNNLFFDCGGKFNTRLNKDEAFKILGGIEIINDSFDEAKYKADAKARYEELLEIARRNASAGNSLAP